MWTMTCPVCGSRVFRHDTVIWDSLASEWQLSDEERQYVDEQQGTACVRCGCALRVCALAAGLRRHYSWRPPLRYMLARRPYLRILEINEAGALTRLFGRFPRHTLATFPTVDVQRLPYADATFDLVVHSDTLEHVEDPLQGLRECRRVLRDGGVLGYTVPVIHGRLSRRRGREEPLSYHGNERGQLYPVVSEYGADMWTEPLHAGFTHVAIESFAWPAATALVCSR